MPRIVFLAVILLVLAAVLYAEARHWRASRRGLPRSRPRGRFTEAIIVLGFRNGGRRANAVNRYRVRAALRSVDPSASRSVLVLCGGAVGGPVPEAELMRDEARRRGWRGPILMDATSRSTEENIRHAIPLIEDADVIRIVSNSLHAEVARGMLRVLRPDLAARLHRAAEHRLGEVVLQKLYAVVRLAVHARSAAS
ncbi:YdcF family protein [Microbacterium sp. NPDC055903]